MQSQLSVITATKGDKVYMVPANATVADAAHQMFEHKIGAVLVGEGDDIQGIFSERDVVTRVVERGLSYAEVPVSSVMTAKPFTVPSTTTIEEALQVVTERHIRHLPLVDDGKLVGLISSSDLTAWVANAQQKEITGLKTEVDSFAAKNKALIALMVGFAALIVVGVLIS